MIKQKQERLKEVYDHLRRYYGVHTQIDFAKAIGLTRPAVSSAMNGNESYLTDNLFKGICATYQGVFNLDYLLTGKGDLLSVEEDVRTCDMEHIARVGQDNMMNAVIAAKDQTIAQMELRLSEKDEIISTQKQLIDSLRQRIIELRKSAELEKLDDYPFPGGVADRDEFKQTRV